MKNRYCRHSRISEHKFRKILKYFAEDFTVSDIAKIAGVSRPAVSRRIRGKRGRGAGQKVLVLGILKRGGKVYTQIIPRATKENVLPILQGKVLEDTTVHTDGWRSYDGLINLKNYRVYHSKDEFV